MIHTTGGLPVDELGRVTMEDGKCGRLGYLLPDRLLAQAFTVPKFYLGTFCLQTSQQGTAGHEAGNWAKNCQFGGTKLILEGLEDSRKMIGTSTAKTE